MKANNDNLQIPREIKHWLYFKDIKNKDDFKTNLDVNVFQIIEENTLSVHSEFPFQLIISHTGTVEFEAINQISTQLFKKQ